MAERTAFRRLAGLMWVLSLGNAFAAVPLRGSPVLIVFVSAWLLIFMYSPVRFERRALWLLLAAPFGIAVPLLAHIVASWRLVM